MARVNVSDLAVAEAALTRLLEDNAVDGASGVTACILAATSKIRFQPSTRQLVLTFDLTFGVTDTDQGSGPVE
jgi:hypothetical protein